jgi:hypothetical protein
MAREIKIIDWAELDLPDEYRDELDVTYGDADMTLVLPSRLEQWEDESEVLKAALLEDQTFINLED